MRPFNKPFKPAQVRLIDDTGKQLGIFPWQEAENLAKEKGLDLIIVSPKTEPPIAKIGDLGKFLYHKAKKEKEFRLKHKQKEQKEIQISVREGKGDLQRKASKVAEFIAAGHQVQIRLMLRGREKYNKEFAREKFSEFLKIIPGEFKEVQSLKIFPNILTIVLIKK